MQLRTVIVTVVTAILLTSTVFGVTDSEEEYVNKYLKKYEKKHTTKLTWISGFFSLNRINRDNDYNKFANYETTNFTDGTIPWLGEAKTFGADFGLVFNKRFAWTVSGEYWMKLGESLEGSYFYEPTGTYIDNPETQVQVYGAMTGVQYYVTNPPSVTGEMKDIALRVGAKVGFFKAKWDVWEDYENLNLSTSTAEASTASFEDQGIGLSFHVGADYPTRLWDLVLGVDMGYLYLNFDNVAWYNEQDDEIVASYTGDADGRVNLGLSGFRGKIELKHFFSW